MMPKHTIKNLLDFYFGNDDFKEEIIGALKDFFEQSDLGKESVLEVEEGGDELFNEWFVHDYRLKNGKTLLEDYYSRNPAELSRQQMKIYKDLQSSIFSLFQIILVKQGKGLKILDLLTNIEYEVREVMATYQLKQGDILFQRIAMIDGHYELVGADNNLAFIGGFDKKILENIEFDKIKLNPKLCYHIFRTERTGDGTAINKQSEKSGYSNTLKPFPRNEFELCSLFEDLVFLRTEKFVDAPSIIKVGPRDKEALFESGFVNLIFRRWLQTAWGEENWSGYFLGTTPRQELARSYPALDKGEMSITARMSKDRGEWRILPVIFSKIKDGSSDVFDFSLAESKKCGQDLFYPVYDKNFNKFSNWLEETIRKNQPFEKDHFDDIFFTRFHAFWNNAAANILFNISLDAPRSRILAATPYVQEIMTRYFQKYHPQEDNFLETDVIFQKIWRVLENLDAKILPSRSFIDKEKAEGNQESYNHSSLVFYQLGIAFDQLVLFPMEQYFGGAEIVWIEKENFFNDLLVTWDLLKKRKNVSNRDVFKSYKAVASSDDLEEVWHSPCTAFRPIGKVSDYFKNIG